VFLADLPASHRPAPPVTEDQAGTGSASDANQA
jgi:hypothetical protein